MKQTHFPSQTWIAPLVGTVLIVIGCCQLVYSTLLVAAAIGFALIEGLLSAGGELLSGEPGDDGSGEARVAMISRGPFNCFAVSILRGFSDRFCVTTRTSCSWVRSGITRQPKPQSSVYRPDTCS